MVPTTVYVVESRAQSSYSSKQTPSTSKPQEQKPGQEPRRGLGEVAGLVAQGLLMFIFFPLIPPLAHMALLPVSKKTAVCLSTINAGTEAPLQIVFTLWLVMRGLV